MRKTIVYHYRDIDFRLRKDLRSTPPKTMLYAKLKLALAFNDLRIAFFDTSGKWSAYYAMDKLNKAHNRK